MKRILNLLASMILLWGTLSCENPTNSDAGIDPKPASGGSKEWIAMSVLPAVDTAYSFALGINDSDGSIKLGYMFNGDDYKAKLTLTGGYVGGDANVFSLYDLDLTNNKWTANGGRTTPQNYKYSELVFDKGESYYTTNFSSYGGLVSAIKNGTNGTFARTPAYTNERSHDIAFLNNKLYAVLLEKKIAGGWMGPGSEGGVYLESIAKNSFVPGSGGGWTSKLKINAASDGFHHPRLISAGTYLVLSYYKAGKLMVRATDDPENLKTADDFHMIAEFETAEEDATMVWDGDSLYLGYIDSSNTLCVKSTGLATHESVSWKDCSVTYSGAPESFDLAARSDGAALAVQTGSTIKVYETLSSSAGLSKDLSGAIDLEADTKGNLVLSVCGDDKILRSFLYR